VILSACYALWLYRKVIFGVIATPALAGMSDLGRREILVLAPLVFLTILFGVYPKPVLDMSAASVAQLLENYQAATAPKKAEAEAIQFSARPRESGDPVLWPKNWMPAFAGMSGVWGSFGGKPSSPATTVAQ
jgi:hypothetical protein